MKYSCVVVVFSCQVVSDSATPWTAAHQSLVISWSLPKFMSFESVMPSNHLTLSPSSPPAFNLTQHQGLFQRLPTSTLLGLRPLTLNQDCTPSAPPPHVATLLHSIPAISRFYKEQLSTLRTNLHALWNFWNGLQLCLLPVQFMLQTSAESADGIPSSTKQCPDL